ncbi:MAG: hypothetical protein JO327_02790 [Nitrososphaeraceae archaeon]|nr:hypothetical protein [Nitrososphaeraceae archaeon]MBV9667037.1 hypothetical protein [Nitrososphaeraceae archaeon]
MIVESQLHFISAIAIILAAVVPIYLTIRLINKKLKKITLVFSIFILIHSFYHITGYFNFEFLADRVFEPLSVVILIVFGIVYSLSFRTKHMVPRNMAVAMVVWNLGTLISMNNITLILLLVALGIFVWLAVRSRNIRSFQLQMSIFLIIWILGEIVGNLQGNGMVIFSILQGNVGLEIHTISMIFFSTMISLRFYYSERNGKMMIEEELGAADGRDTDKSSNGQK